MLKFVIITIIIFILYHHFTLKKLRVIHIKHEPVRLSVEGGNY